MKFPHEVVWNNFGHNFYCDDCDKHFDLEGAIKHIFEKQYVVVETPKNDNSNFKLGRPQNTKKYSSKLQRPRTGPPRY